MKKMKVGFIGLGLMGKLMAKNILKNGFPLFVYNRTISKTKDLEKLGATVSRSPADLSSKVDVLITMVTGPLDVKQVLFGKNGVIKGAKKELIVIDMSTIGQKSAKYIDAKLKKREIYFLDAPVTGSTPKALTGELTIFIGGKESVYNKAKPVLLAMGKNLIYMGSTGNGQAIKLINNHLIASTMVALSEGMKLADTMNVSRTSVAKALESSPILSPQMNLVMPNFVHNDFQLRFSIANLKKDLSLAVAESKLGANKLKLLSLTESVYRKALKENLGDEDYTAIIKAIEKK